MTHNALEEAIKPRHGAGTLTESITCNVSLWAACIGGAAQEGSYRALIEGAGSRGHKVMIGGELFSDAMGPSGTYEGSYIGMIDHNVTVIVRALGGEAPPGGMQGKLRGIH